jgi:hypothetical protein
MIEPQPDPNPPSAATDAEEIAGDHGGAFDVATDRLEECRRQFEETGNGIYAWEGILICTGRYMERYGGVPLRPFPDWLMTYLRKAAIGIVSLGNLNDPATRPDRAAAGGDDKLYQEALSAWHKQKIKATDATRHAITVLNLDVPPSETGTRTTKNRFTQYQSDMKDLTTAIFVRHLGRGRVVDKSGHGSKTPTDRRLSRGKKIRPRLKK